MSAGQEVGQIFGEDNGPATGLLRSPTVIIATIGLWGMNIYFFKLFHIDYKRVLTPGSGLHSDSSANNTGVGNEGDGGGCEEEEGGGGKRLTRYKDSEDENDEDSDLARLKDILSDGNGDIIDDDDVVVMENGIDGSGSGSNIGTHKLNRSSSSTATGHVTKSTISTQHSVKPSSGAGFCCGSATGSGGGGEITSARLLSLSLFLLLLLHLTSYTWMNVLGGDALGAVFAFYASVILGLIVCYKETKWARNCIRIVYYRVLELLKPRFYCFFPHIRCCRPRIIQPVPFVDVFFADAMCSMSKVFFDWGMLFHMASHYPHPVPAAVHNIVIPSFCAALPYLIRARQCLVMHTWGKMKNDPKRYQHILNAIKYSTSLFPICLSAYQKTVSDEEADQLEKLLIALLTINSLYAFSWDVVMDWGMMHDPASLIDPSAAMAACVTVPKMSLSPLPTTAAAMDMHTHNNVPNSTLSATPSKINSTSGSASKGCKRACLRPKLRFGVCISCSILITNFVLRFFWLMRFWELEIFSNVDVYILCTEFFEIFRRAIWNLLRVEWENIKTQPQHSMIMMNRGGGVGASSSYEEDGYHHSHPHIRHGGGGGGGPQHLFYTQGASSGGTAAGTGAISMVPLNPPTTMKMTTGDTGSGSGGIMHTM